MFGAMASSIERQKSMLRVYLAKLLKMYEDRNGRPPATGSSRGYDPKREKKHKLSKIIKKVTYEEKLTVDYLIYAANRDMSRTKGIVSIVSLVSGGGPFGGDAFSIYQDVDDVKEVARSLGVNPKSVVG